MGVTFLLASTGLADGFGRRNVLRQVSPPADSPQIAWVPGSPWRATRLADRPVAGPLAR
ncbi:MAG: hypothetical protein QOH29_558, partial [Actinomycetota bacterium]|nr:hypothetical protein [Actinomycetota bacterium]